MLVICLAVTVAPPGRAQPRDPPVDCATIRSIDLPPARPAARPRAGLFSIPVWIPLVDIIPGREPAGQNADRRDAYLEPCPDPSAFVIRLPSAARGPGIMERRSRGDGAEHRSHQLEQHLSCLR